MQRFMLEKISAKLYFLKAIIQQHYKIEELTTKCQSPEFCLDDIPLYRSYSYCSNLPSKYSNVVLVNYIFSNYLGTLAVS